MQAAKAAKGQAHAGGCPGSRMRTMQEKPEAPAAAGDVPSQLRQWPVLLGGAAVFALLTMAAERSSVRRFEQVDL